MQLHHNYEEQSSFQPLPPGEYYCAIEKCTPRKSKNGNEMYALQLGLLNESKRKIFDNIFIDEGFLASHVFATNKLVSLLHSCGFPCGSNKGDEFTIPMASAFIAKCVYVQVALDKQDSSKNMVFHYYGQPFESREHKKKASSNGAAQIQKAVSQQAAPTAMDVARPTPMPNCPF